MSVPYNISISISIVIAIDITTCTRPISSGADSEHRSIRQVSSDGTSLGSTTVLHVVVLWGRQPGPNRG